jgi:DNA-directed RNA polymerase sigma subunit (sigma70/sigma32)
MDKLAYLPKPAATTLDDSDQADEPDQPGEATVRDYLKLVPDPDVQVEDQVISEIEAARIRRLLGTLPKLEQLVITWHFGLKGEPLSRPAIAHRLRLSTGAVRRIELDALRELHSLALGQGRAA